MTQFLSFSILTWFRLFEKKNRKNTVVFSQPFFFQRILVMTYQVCTMSTSVSTSVLLRVIVCFSCRTFSTYLPRELQPHPSLPKVPLLRPFNPFPLTYSKPNTSYLALSFSPLSLLLHVFTCQVTHYFSDRCRLPVFIFLT